MRVIARASARRSPARTDSASAISLAPRAGRFAAPAAFRSLALATGPFSIVSLSPTSYAGFETRRKMSDPPHAQRWRQALAAASRAFFPLAGGGWGESGAATQAHTLTLSHLRGEGTRWGSAFALFSIKR